MVIFIYLFIALIAYTSIKRFIINLPSWEEKLLTETELEPFKKLFHQKNQAAGLIDTSSKGLLAAKIKLGPPHLATIGYMLEQGCDANQYDLFSDTPMLSAVYRPQTSIELIQLLLEHSADIHIPDSLGYTPIMVEMLKPCSNPKIIELLKTHGAELSPEHQQSGKFIEDLINNEEIPFNTENILWALNQVNDLNKNEPQTLLFQIIEKYHRTKTHASEYLAIIKWMLGHGADINIPYKMEIDDESDPSLDYPLRILLSHGIPDEQLLEILLTNQADFDILCDDEEEPTPLLHQLAHKLTPDEFEYLYRKMPSFERSKQSGYSPLILAAEAQHLAIVEELLAAGGDISEKAPNDKSLLHIVLENPKADMKLVQSLLSHNILESIEDKFELALLATRCEDTDIFSYFLQFLPDINQKDRDGNTALFYCLGNRNPKILELLLRLGADVTIQNNDGDTAVHRLCRYTIINQQAITRLVEAGANINAVDHSGCTPLMDAAEIGADPVAIQFLIDLGATRDATDHDGDSALIRAVKSGFSDIGSLKVLNPERNWDNLFVPFCKGAAIRFMFLQSPEQTRELMHFLLHELNFIHHLKLSEKTPRFATLFNDWFKDNMTSEKLHPEVLDSILAYIDRDEPDKTIFYSDAPYFLVGELFRPIAMSQIQKILQQSLSKGPLSPSKLKELCELKKYCLRFKPTYWHKLHFPHLTDELKDAKLLQTLLLRGQSGGLAAKMKSLMVNASSHHIIGE